MCLCDLALAVSSSLISCTFPSPSELGPAGLSSVLPTSHHVARGHLSFLLESLP